MSFCLKHATFYRYGDCPSCLRNLVAGYVEARQDLLVARRTELLQHPDRIRQDGFGICGTTTAVHLLLRHKHQMLHNLFEATFADLIADYSGTRFRTARFGLQSIKFSYLSRRFALREAGTAVTALAAAVAPALQRARQAVNRPAPQLNVDRDYLVDFCLSRALGYVFKQVAPLRYESEKVEFNAEFDPLHAREYRNFTRAMGLALRTQNLAFIMRDILGANQLLIAHNRISRHVVPEAQYIVAPLTFYDERMLRHLFQLRLNGQGRFALAAVFAELITRVPEAGGTTHQAFVRPARLDYTHWVLINSYDHEPPAANGPCPHGHVRMNIWTWGQSRNVTVCDVHLLSYLQDVIFGNLD